MAGNDFPLRSEVIRLYLSIREFLLDDIREIIGTTIIGGKLNGGQVGGKIPSSVIPDTTVTPGTYGDSTHVGQFTVESDGRLTAASNVAISASATMEVTQPDASVDVTSVNKIIVPNGSVTNDGGGTVQLVYYPHVAPVDPTTTEGDLIYRHVVTTTTVNVGFIGDSITGTVPTGGSQSPAQATASDLSVGGLTVTSATQFADGSTTADWLPGAGTGYLTTAKAAFASVGVRIIHIMLGTNDSEPAHGPVSAATYFSNMQSICQNLVSAGYLVVVSYPPYVVPGSASGAYTSASDTALQGYQQQINNLVNGRTILQGDTQAFNFFLDNQSDLVDGIHPTPAGVTVFGTLWSQALSLIVKSITSQVVLAALHPTSDGDIMKLSGGLPSWQTDTSASALSGLSDVSEANLANNDGLLYSTVDDKWHNSPLMERLHEHVYQEDLTAQADSSTTMFILAQEFEPYTTRVFKNGSLLRPGSGNDYTEDTTMNDAIVFGAAPTSGDKIIVEYIAA